MKVRIRKGKCEACDGNGEVVSKDLREFARNLAICKQVHFPVVNGGAIPLEDRRGSYLAIPKKLVERCSRCTDGITYEVRDIHPDDVELIPEANHDA